MNITFILGNGFDLQCGLATRYSDFLKEYVEFQPEDNENIRQFKSYLSKAEEQELWSDAEIAMGQYLFDFSNRNIGLYLERIKDFQYKMIYYLEKQQNRCSWKDEYKIWKVFQSFLIDSFQDIYPPNDIYLDIKNLEKDHLYNIITFNYTNLINKIILISRSNIINRRVSRSEGSELTYTDIIQSVYHIHGELSSQIIMGVNDESQLKIGPMLSLTRELKRQLIKPRMNSGMYHNWDAPAMQTIQNSDVIAIYGVSYGTTDDLWWSMIKNWLESDQNHKLVSFERNTEEEPVFRLAWEKVIYDEKKRETVLKKLGIKEGNFAYDRLVNQVYIIENTKRLNLRPLILEEEPSKLRPSRIIIPSGTLVYK